MKTIMELSLQEKLEILTDAAKYDVACTSSGVQRKGTGSGMGNTVSSGICHCFSQDGRCISLLKILYTNECIYDCKYCINRKSNEVVRTSFEPEEVALLTIDFYKRNYIEGLFLSSGILNTPDYTMEKIYQVVYLLRKKYNFEGYIHVKAIPGASSELVQLTGWLADRMSVNLELPTAEGLRQLAPNKTRNNILKPMKQIQLQRKQNMLEIQENRRYGNDKNVFLISQKKNSNTINERGSVSVYNGKMELAERNHFLKQPRFVPAGQSTQMIIGATKESDYQILKVTEALYQKFDLKRVFYSAFINVNQEETLPALNGKPPLLREHRLYQADWLLRFYGFMADEILSEGQPDFNPLLDPKCNWAIGHLEYFPVEINQADYKVLLRVPGIGVKSAQKIVKARRFGKLNFEDLKKIGVVLKRALYFITCNGKMMYPVKIEEKYILNHMLEWKEKLPFEEQEKYHQMTLEDYRHGEKGII